MLRTMVGVGKTRADENDGRNLVASGGGAMLNIGGDGSNGLVMLVLKLALAVVLLWVRIRRRRQQPQNLWRLSKTICKTISSHYPIDLLKPSVTFIDV